MIENITVIKNEIYIVWFINHIILDHKPIKRLPVRLKTIHNKYIPEVKFRVDYNNSVVYIDRTETQTMDLIIEYYTKEGE